MCLIISPVTVRCCAVKFVVCLFVCLPIACFMKKHEEGEEYVVLCEELLRNTSLLAL